jgi:uncharacterized protein YndB with AHSA1/START domain
MTQKITVETKVAAPIAEVWRAWNTPEDITKWNSGSPEWHTPRATVDLRVGGSFCSRMEAKDGSAGFDLAGTYTKIVENQLIETAFGDRTSVVKFSAGADGVTVQQTFDAEETNSIEMQRGGWQTILDNFKKHVESRRRA